MENSNKDVIDVGKIFKLLWSKKRLFIKVWVITFALSCLWILPKPRYYSADVTLAPEKTDEDIAGGLSSLASSFGLSIGTSTDAIYPMLYPDLIASHDFIIGLFDIPVRSLDGEINCDLYTYMDKHQKTAFYEVPFIRLGRWMRNTFGEKEPDVKAFSKGGNVNGVNPSFMSRRQKSIVEKLGKLITCDVDKKTEVFTVSVLAQDKLIATTLADSVVARLQRFITDYRTSKARLDFIHYQELCDEAKKNYEEARLNYARFSDAYTDLYMPSYKTKLTALDNEMQLRYTTYTTLVAQREMAQAKVQERTPAFTTMQSATVPQKPAEPKRMLFCIGMLFLVTFVTVVCLLFKNKEALAKEDTATVAEEE